MKLPQTYQLHNIFLMLLGPLLIICILISGSYIVETFKDVAYTKQKSFWSIVQLDRELAHTQVKVNEYIHDLTTAKSLEMSYNILWSRIPIAMNTLSKDVSLARIENSSNITVLIDDLFVDVKRFESVIVGQDKISKVALAVWKDVLREHEEAIRGNLIHNLASSNSIYAKQTTTTILKAATIPLFFVICFFLYLSYLLSALWNEQQINQKMLDHDSMTKLHSRDFMMNTLKTLSKTNEPFILLAMKKPCRIGEDSI
ncbi:hypothetical protein [Leucothrix pacifica]|uniref:Uncharacterized protein n=1 Tax=Leucothrix pacifica TaxID=1247513 RepID=A0A317CMW2_9GAMM|nr:hypothetical protein [Leucothrix pacifica]PWQ97642.1 hypothetical protein DKW60_09685 [Leucothrix pacifica]